MRGVEPQTAVPPQLVESTTVPWVVRQNSPVANVPAATLLKRIWIQWAVRARSVPRMIVVRRCYAVIMTGFLRGQVQVQDFRSIDVQVETLQVVVRIGL